MGFRQFEDSSFSVITYIDENGRQETLEFPMDKQIALPLHLEPYDAYEGCVFILFFPDTDAASESVKMTVETTKGKSSKSSRIWCLKTIVDDGDGPFFQ